MIKQAHNHNWKWKLSSVYWFCADKNCSVISAAHHPKEIDKLYIENERLDRLVKRCQKLHPTGAWNHCACRFNETDTQTDWCVAHAEMRDGNERLRDKNDRFAQGFNNVLRLVEAWLLEGIDEGPLPHLRRLLIKALEENSYATFHDEGLHHKATEALKEPD